MTKEPTPTTPDPTSHRLTGSLAPSRIISSMGKRDSQEKTAAPVSRLRGNLVDKMLAAAEAKYAVRAPTWELQFGKYGTGYGDLVRDGYEARNSNHSSGQDAFAVSVDHKRFAVADGMGGSGYDKPGTAFFAKYLADYAVVHSVDDLFDPIKAAEIYGQAERVFQDTFGRPFSNPATAGIRGKSVLKVATTLTVAEVIDASSVRVIAIGDSPGFVTDKDFYPTKKFGEDAQSGAFDQPLGFYLGIQADGTPCIPERGTVHRGKSVVDTLVTVPSDGAFVIGTDYFSEAVESGYGGLAPFIGKDAIDFCTYVSSNGKPDDATLITIRPSLLVR